MAVRGLYRRGGEYWVEGEWNNKCCMCKNFNHQGGAELVRTLISWSSAGDIADEQYRRKHCLGEELNQSNCCTEKENIHTYGNS
jgi:hypothetical protein